MVNYGIIANILALLKINKKKGEDSGFDARNLPLFWLNRDEIIVEAIMMPTSYFTLFYKVRRTLYLKGDADRGTRTPTSFDTRT